MHDFQLCSDCPNEIAEEKPGVIIVDNGRYMTSKRGEPPVSNIIQA